MNLGEAYFWHEHLWIVVTLPDDKSKAVVVVNVSTWHVSKDHACVVEPGEHPWIRTKSVIMYSFARALNVGEQEDFTQGSIRQSDASQTLVDRIQEQAEESEFTSQHIVAMIRASAKKQRATKRR
jgi:hypothetical protein